MSNVPESFLRLASYNIRTPCDKAPNDWASRQPRLLALLNRHDIAIAGLQEAMKMQIDGILSEGSWDYTGVAREDGVEKGEYSCIIYRKDRFICHGSKTFWLSETPEVAGSRSWETACTRICTWATFTDKKTGLEFTHFNTHLDHRSKLAQINGVKLIFQKMQEISPKGPVVLTGDFNVLPEDEVIAHAEKFMRNSTKITETPLVGPTYTFTGYRIMKDGVEPPHKGPIDYIFVNNEFHVRNLFVFDDMENDLYPSDHFPLVADLY